MSRTIPRRLARSPRVTHLIRFLSSPASGVVALLLLLLPGALLAQAPAGPVSIVPVKVTSVVTGVVTGWDAGTKVATLQGSRLLQVDLSSARIAMADADPADAIVPQIAPGAFLTAVVEAPDIAITVFPPPPLTALEAVVRPPGTAFLRGEIESVGVNGFGLLHRMILVDGQTAFSGWNGATPVQGLSDLVAGMRAEVWVVASGDTLTAVRVVARGTFGPTVLSFRGVVKEIGTNAWTIGDTTVEVTAETRIVGDPKIGDTVDVVANQYDPPTPGMMMPTRVVAVSIVKVQAAPPPTPGRSVTFEGLVQKTPPVGMIGLWRIDDRAVTVTGQTKIEGSPKVGSRVAVTGYSLPGPVVVGSAPSVSSTGMSAVPFFAVSIRTIP